MCRGQCIPGISVGGGSGGVLAALPFLPGAGLYIEYIRITELVSKHIIGKVILRAIECIIEIGQSEHKFTGSQI